MSAISPVVHRRSSSIGHGGAVFDSAEEAAIEITRVLPGPTRFGMPLTQVIDLEASDYTTAALQTVLAHAGQALRSGAFPDMRLVFVVSNPALAEFVRLVARANRFPFYIATSKSDLASAQPVGDLTAAEEQTLEVLRQLGGRATAAELGRVVGLTASAATNRLSLLDQKGYLTRVRRHRRQGDEYVDPRASTPPMAELRNRAIKPVGAALRAAGITTDPWSMDPITLQGEDAERAVEILRRRGHA